MRVIVDDREWGGGVLEALGRIDGVEAHNGRLPVGDYLVDDWLLFERKTLLDLAASVKDGRLFSQSLRLVGSPLRCALILEGTSRDLTSSRMRRESIQGALIYVTLFLGIPLLRSMDAEETARLMLYSARQGRRFASAIYPRKGRRPSGKQRVQSEILQGFPGIGPERARRLLAHFGSIEAIITAEQCNLAAVPGIGQATAEKIHWAVHDQPLSDGDPDALDAALDEASWFFI